MVFAKEHAAKIGEDVIDHRGDGDEDKDFGGLPELIDRRIDFAQ